MFIEKYHNNEYVKLNIHLHQTRDRTEMQHKHSGYSGREVAECVNSQQAIAGYSAVLVLSLLSVMQIQQSRCHTERCLWCALHIHKLV